MIYLNKVPCKKVWQLQNKGFYKYVLSKDAQEWQKHNGF
jgi:hypothetical protein